jgi:phosphoglycolate phosphatase
MNHNLRAVLFDFDGTLGDSYPAITASVNHVRQLHHLPPLSEAEVRRHVGRGPACLLEHTVPAGNVADNIASYKAHHPSVLREGTRLMPGAREILRVLDESGMLLGVCSNKPVAFTRELLDYLSVAKHIDIVLGPEDVASPKPAPDMLREALRRLGVSPDEALYIGDMTVDVQTARGAGVPVWIAPTGSDTVEAIARASPDRIVPSLTEAAHLLRSMVIGGPP